MIVDGQKTGSSQSPRQHSTHSESPAPSSSTTNQSSSPPLPPRRVESLAQAAIQPPPLPPYAPRTSSLEFDSRQAGGYDHDQDQRPSLHSEKSSSTFSDMSEKDNLPGYSLKLDAEASFQDDGRLQISFGNRLSKSLPDNYAEPVHEVGIDEANFRNAPPMSINIMIVGSRGDVQPYLALGQRLQRYGHTVRLSTHETFRKLVKDAGLRFFNIGGDPHELMSYMVRNPGLIPGFESLRNGDIGKKQKMVAEMLDRCFLSCYEADEGSEGEPGFAADAIISNPPTFAHIHCAEAFGIPLLLSFTMPWCSTAAFPHPLVNIKQTGSSEPKAVNYYSYGLVDLLTWQGLGHTINKFRMKRLGLEYLSTTSAVGMIERCGVPWTYCLSPALVPKPEDWMSHIDVVGFYFLDLAKDYDPPADLVEFICSGEPPIYVGFGSIVLENPQEMTKAILGGIARAGVRAIVSPGWGGLDETMIKAAGPHVFALGNVPHDWLFEYVSAVCHHGGAGTTAIGLKCGKPTMIVPFFGDQPWWAAQLARRGAGPPPLDPKKLTAEAFASAIRVALSPDTIEAAKKVGAMVREEDGTQNGVDSFHRHLPLLNMRCDLDPSRVAVWYCPAHKLRLSAFAAQVLAEGGEIDMNKLKLYRSREYDTHVEAIDPVTGTVAPAIKVLNDFGRGVAKLPTRPDKGLLKMTTAGIVGLQTTLQGATEGLSNVPKLYGGEVREHKKVTGFGSGVVEGSKGLAFGIYDGLTDFVKQPAKGYEEKGVLGAVGGFGIGSMNLMTKPIAGMMQAFSMPMEGTAKDLRALFRKEIGKERLATRHAEGVMAVKRASQRDRDVVIKAFAAYKVRTRREKKGKGKGI